MAEITSKFLEKIQSNKRIRQTLAREDPMWFSLLYLRDHFDYPFAPFHIEMFHLIRQEDFNLIAVMAFRESGKSTIMNLANVLWSILGKPEKKFAIIIGKTQEQAKNHFLNIKAELENNDLLIEDFGPFAEDNDDLKRLSLELVYHESKIMSLASEQSIRGLKYGQHRPGLIICDDLEDLFSVFDYKESDLLYDRFYKEIVPAGNLKTKIVVLGNLLSQDSLIMRLKNDIREKQTKGVFRAYPLVDDEGLVLWQSKFNSPEKINELRNKLSEDSWSREYLLSLDGRTCISNDLSEKLPDLTDKENYMHVISRRCRYKLLSVEKHYKDIFKKTTIQGALIPQMEMFKIAIPSKNDIEAPWPDDPLFETYQEYEREKREIADEYKKELKESIHARCEMRAFENQ
ncbi:MAG: hypothetical protein A2570_03780 [Candidatus Brennerbacteria bacterium RIFOXYD1_FULL_41_16]|uniref:Terminase large subunit gp17-like C-terminal domain-containing protein n=1 Tax=Candidatus Brennerbacteria bacterium RIFOXYD1_FULL_41_16 TaxID=1797529 RepID=A0A1G1XK30_9BACT|nr:MAG: hypothetical protein A2570_03780 [Candidatus Brennerbacteria bacterium RIFOXYD1_FULL_41_16]